MSQITQFFKSKLFRRLGSVALTIFLLVLVLRQIPKQGFLAVFATLRWQWLALAMVFYFVSSFVRARRLQVLGISSLPLPKLVNISFIHYFLSNILPFRSGELSFVYLINKERAASLSVNVSALFLTRVFDFVSVIIWLIVSSVALFPQKFLNMDPIVLGSFALLVLLLILLIMVIFGRGLIGKAVGYFLKLLKRFFPKAEQGFETKWQEIGFALDVIRSRRVLGLVLLFSLLGWFFIYIITYCFLQAVGYPLSLWGAMFVTSFPPIAALIPLGTLGNFGTVEAGWALGFNLLGAGIERAITLSLVMHVLTILMQSLTTCYALMMRRFGE